MEVTMSMVDSLADDGFGDAYTRSSGMKERNPCVVHLSIPSERIKRKQRHEGELKRGDFVTRGLSDMRIAIEINNASEKGG